MSSASCTRRAGRWATVAEFRMPSLGADMDEGTITEWLVHPGDVVHRGDIVAVVDTDKADVDVEIFENGVVEELLVPAGERVAVGTPLATVRTDGAASAATPESATVPRPREPLPGLRPLPARPGPPRIAPRPRHRSCDAWQATSASTSRPSSVRAPVGRSPGATSSAAAATPAPPAGPSRGRGDA